MKTLAEFIQRLQDDAAFEKRAQAFDNGEELMAFVKSEGYDFTLEQLTIEFKQGAKLSTAAGEMAPAPGDAGASTARMHKEAEFSGQPEAFPNAETNTALPRTGSHDFTRGQPSGELQTPGPEGNSPEALPRIGGGRHRGFSSQRLKSIPGEEP
jgi:predicted ribosomally synthesized peptide with nif11-like leader